MIQQDELNTVISVLTRKIIDLNEVIEYDDKIAKRLREENEDLKKHLEKAWKEIEESKHE